MTSAKAGGWIIAIIGTAFAVVVIGFMIAPPETTSLPDRMARECAYQYPAPWGQEKRNDCVIRLMLRYAAETEQNKMDEAYRRSR